MQGNPGAHSGACRKCRLHPLVFRYRYLLPLVPCDECGSLADQIVRLGQRDGFLLLS